jgi:hypothetical protein
MAGDEIRRLPIPPTTLRSPGEGSRQKTPPEMGSLGALSLSLSLSLSLHAEKGWVERRYGFTYPFLFVIV